MIKGSSINNNIDSKKNVNKLQNNNLYIIHNSLDDELNLINIKTEPNLKHNFTKAINKLTKNRKIKKKMKG